MANKINYNNKAPFQTLEEIPDENKVNADDMNEIKTVVNNNADELDTAKENIESLQNGQGTSNADITNLKNRVSTLETDNSTNKTDISSLKTEQEEQNNRLNILEEDNTTNKQDISNIKSEQTEQDKQIDMLINALPSETSEAENINIKGTIPTKFKEFVVGGNSKQETRSGKNIVNINSADIVNIDTTIEVENNTLTVTGSSTNNFYSAIPIKLKPNTDYSISTLATVVEQNGLSQSAYIRVRSDLAGSWIGNSILINKDLTTQQNLKGTFNSGDNENAYLILYLSPLNDETQRSAKIEFDNLQVEEGTVATEYEPYGAMPSPKFPSEIQNVEGNVNVTVCNKNLFTGFVKGKGLFSSTGEEKVDDKSGTSNFIQVNFDKNESYCISGLTDTISSFVAFYNKNKEYLGRNSGSLRTSMSFNSNSYSSMAQNYESIKDKNIRFIRVTQYEVDNSIGTIDDIDNLQVQLETGSTTTDYVEHQEQLITFPLAQGQKLMLGDYLAADGIHHKRTQIELPLVSKLQSTSIGGVNCQFASYLIADIKRENGMSNNFLCEKVSFSGYQFNKYKGYIIQKNFVVLTDLEDTVENINQLLAGTILEYELQNEIVEPYTEEQEEAYNQLKQLTAYEEETNIYSTNSTSPIFKVTAVKDINSVITQLNTVLLERS